MMLKYKKNSLFMEGVELGELAKKEGTPLFVYSAGEIEKNFSSIAGSFSKVDHLVCYSAKSNSNGAVLRVLSKLGSGADIVSGGELFRALKAGMNPEKIVFSGVGKTDEDMEYALRKGIMMFNIESVGELKALDKVAARLKKKAPIAIRINPDIEVDTHHHITTGKAENKFGINFPHVVEAYLEAQRLPNIKIIGIQMHLGSQIKETRPYIKGMKKLSGIIRTLSLLGIGIEYLDIGGGFGIAYDEKEKIFPMKEFSLEVGKLVKNSGVKLILEPGRFVVGPSGVMITKVLYTKYTRHKNFQIVDAGMNDLIRPSLYSAYHAVLPLKKTSRRKMVVDVVGPVCESGDYFAKGRMAAECFPGEFIAVKDAGAYGFVMSSTYNSRPRAAEVMVSGNKYKVVRRRETYKDLIEGERNF